MCRETDSSVPALLRCEGVRPPPFPRGRSPRGRNEKGKRTVRSAPGPGPPLKGPGALPPATSPLPKQPCTRDEEHGAERGAAREQMKDFGHPQSPEVSLPRTTT